MKVKILPVALQDLEEGYGFYEQQLSGLGSYLYSDIDSLQISAGFHSVHCQRFYRLLARRFPFAIYYQVKHDVAVVYAVLDCRGNPSWIREKLMGLTK